METSVILGVGSSAEVHGVLDEADAAVWVPYDAADVARFRVVGSQLRAAGHAVRATHVTHENEVVECVRYMRGESSVEDATDDEIPTIVRQLGEWVAGFRRVGLAFYHFSPKHILRAPGGGYILTGLAHAFCANAPPSPTIHDFGPYSLVGDSPLSFFSSGALEHAGVVELLMDHCVGVCTVLLVEKIATDIVACATYSSTAAQLRLTLGADAVDQVLREHCHARSTSLEKHIAILSRRRRCCVVC